MAIKHRSNVYQLSTTTGNGSTIALLGDTVSVDGVDYGKFSDFMSNGDRTWIKRWMGSAWEELLVEYSSGSLTIISVLASTNGDAQVDWGAGTKRVFCALPATETSKFVSGGYAQGLSGSEQGQARSNIGAALRGHIYGLTTANNGTDANNDIDVAAGEAASDAASPVLMVLGSTLTKRLDAAWAVGSGNGGLDTGSKANSTWYYLWLIHRSDTKVTDALFSTSSSAPTMPANYDHKRLIWAVRTNGSGNILGYIQVGDRCLWPTNITEVSAVSVTSITSYTLASVPPLLGVIASTGLFLYNPSAVGAARVFSALATNTPYNIANAAAGTYGAAAVDILVNGSGQIKAQNSVGTNQLTVDVCGFRFPF